MYQMPEPRPTKSSMLLQETVKSPMRQAGETAIAGLSTSGTWKMKKFAGVKPKISNQFAATRTGRAAPSVQ